MLSAKNDVSLSIQGFIREQKSEIIFEQRAGYTLLNCSQEDTLTGYPFLGRSQA